MTTQPQWSAVDDATADLLTVLADDGAAILSPAEEWEDFCASLQFAAFWDDGTVSANRMRSLTRGKISPQRVGPFYRRACLEGLIAPAGWETSDDREGKNAGRPARCYTWLGGGEGK